MKARIITPWCRQMALHQDRVALLMGLILYPAVLTTAGMLILRQCLPE